MEKKYVKEVYYLFIPSLIVLWRTLCVLYNLLSKVLVSSDWIYRFDSILYELMISIYVLAHLILDYGCGEGKYMDYCVHQKKHIVGVDLSKEMVGIYKRGIKNQYEEEGGWSDVLVYNCLTNHFRYALTSLCEGIDHPCLIISFAQVCLFICILRFIAIKRSPLCSTSFLQVFSFHRREYTNRWNGNCISVVPWEYRHICVCSGDSELQRNHKNGSMSEGEQH